MAKQMIRKNECPKSVFFLAFAADRRGSVGLYFLPNLFWQCVKGAKSRAKTPSSKRAFIDYI